jgi:hypothetical protein
MDFYVFNDESTALAAASHIDTQWMYPHDGICALTGVVVEGKQSNCWDIPWQRITDNKWVICRVSEAVRNNATQEQIDFFNTNFPNSIETYHISWRPSE